MNHTKTAQHTSDENPGSADPVNTFSAENPTTMRANSPGRRMAGLLLALGVGLAAGFGAIKSYDAWQDSRAQAYVGGSESAGRYLPTITGTSAFAHQPLQAWLVLAGREHSLNSGQVALPSGSRFQIKLQSAQSGHLAMHAVNPQGLRSAQPIWSGSVQAGQPTTSGVMRLEGTRGQETLLLELLPNPGGAPLLQSRLMFWHV